jgi:hypothetical protein
MALYGRGQITAQRRINFPLKKVKHATLLDDGGIQALH